ncbi:MAG: DUF4328 domain-containing protein [Acidimicrobiia bacterium]
MPVCGYCYRRLRNRPVSGGASSKTGPAAAEEWVRWHEARDLESGALEDIDPSLQTPRFRPLVGLAMVAQLLLAATGLVALVTAAAHLFRLWTTIEIAGPGGEAGFDTRASEQAGTVADVALYIGIGLLLVTGVVFVAWGSRAYRNLPALGITDRRWWTMWTILGWLIPGANLFVPKLIMDDLWRASSPQLPARPGAAWRVAPVGEVVHRWWTLWLGGPAIYFLLVSAIGNDGSSLSRIRVTELAAAIAGVVLAGSVQCARRLVAIVSLAQHRRVSALTAGVAASEKARASRVAAIRATAAGQGTGAPAHRRRVAARPRLAAPSRAPVGAGAAVGRARLPAVTGRLQALAEDIPFDFDEQPLAPGEWPAFAEDRPGPEHDPVELPARTAVPPPAPAAPPVPDPSPAAGPTAPQADPDPSSAAAATAAPPVPDPSPAAGPTAPQADPDSSSVVAAAPPADHDPSPTASPAVPALAAHHTPPFVEPELPPMGPSTEERTEEQDGPLVPSGRRRLAAGASRRRRQGSVDSPHDMLSDDELRDTLDSW